MHMLTMVCFRLLTAAAASVQLAPAAPSIRLAATMPHSSVYSTVCLAAAVPSVRTTLLSSQPQLADVGSSVRMAAAARARLPPSGLRPQPHPSI